MLYARRTRAESLEIARNRKSKAQFKAFKGFPSALIKQQKQYQVKAKCSTTAVAEEAAETAAAEAAAAAAVHQARHQRTQAHTHAYNAEARAHKQPYACKGYICMHYILSTSVCVVVSVVPVCVCVCVGINVALLLRQKPSQGFFAHLRQQMDCLDLASAAAAAAAASPADTVRSFSPTDDLHFHTHRRREHPTRRRAAAVNVSFC